MLKFRAPRSHRWSRRIALFSASIILIALILHRFGRMDTLLAGGLFLTALAGAALALLLGISAAVVDLAARLGGGVEHGRRHRGQPCDFCMAGELVPFYLRMPPLNDVTTDTEHPPEFAALAKRARPGRQSCRLSRRELRRAAGSSPIPTLRTLVIDRPVDECFEP